MTQEDRIQVLSETKQKLESALDTIRPNAFLYAENIIRNRIKGCIDDCAQLMRETAREAIKP